MGAVASVRRRICHSYCTTGRWSCSRAGRKPEAGARLRPLVASPLRPTSLDQLARLSLGDCQPLTVDRLRERDRGVMADHRARGRSRAAGQLRGLGARQKSRRPRLGWKSGSCWGRCGRRHPTITADRHLTLNGCSARHHENTKNCQSRARTDLRQIAPARLVPTSSSELNDSAEHSRRGGRRAKLLYRCVYSFLFAHLGLKATPSKPR